MYRCSVCTVGLSLSPEHITLYTTSSQLTQYTIQPDSIYNIQPEDSNDLLQHRNPRGKPSKKNPRGCSLALLRLPGGSSFSLTFFFFFFPPPSLFILSSSPSSAILHPSFSILSSSITLFLSLSCPSLLLSPNLHCHLFFRPSRLFPVHLSSHIDRQHPLQRGSLFFFLFLFLFF